MLLLDNQKHDYSRKHIETIISNQQEIITLKNLAQTTNNAKQLNAKLTQFFQSARSSYLPYHAHNYANQLTYKYPQLINLNLLLTEKLNDNLPCSLVTIKKEVIV